MKQLILLTICLSASFGTSGNWEIDANKSYVGFSSVKNKVITENHTFKKLSGTVSSSGKARIIISLASVDTLIPIRNERMRAILFEVEKYPEAKITAELKPEEFAKLSAGENTKTEIPMSINLHGVDLSKKVLVKVTRGSGDDYQVRSLEPVIVHAAHFNLSEGLEALRQIAGLKSIDLSVPVTFDLKLIKSSISGVSL